MTYEIVEINGILFVDLYAGKELLFYISARRLKDEHSRYFGMHVASQFDDDDFASVEEAMRAFMIARDELIDMGWSV